MPAFGDDAIAFVSPIDFILNDSEIQMTAGGRGTAALDIADLPGLTRRWSGCGCRDIRGPDGRLLHVT